MPVDPATASVTRLDRSGKPTQVLLSATYQYVNPRTGKVETIPEGISPGFNYPKGTSNARINEAVVSKISELPAPLQSLVKADFSS
jgi:predicted PP-loop superfamily ATPase